MSPWVVGPFLVTAVFTAATCFQPRALQWTAGRETDHLLQVLLGDGRKILANHMFVQADVYFHSGYYPSVFDQKHAPKDASHMTDGEAESGHVHPEACDHGTEAHVHTAECDHGDEAHVHTAECDHGEAGHVHTEACGHDHGAADPEDEHMKAMAFLREPRDWIEAFGRRFMITEHKHLAGGTEREMLPFLKLSAQMDPHRIETYTVAAYWLRRTLGRVDEAEEFLRAGLKANPQSYEILFELGRLYYENRQDPQRAGNLWRAALDRWNRQELAKEKPDLFALDEIAVRLSRVAEEQGNRDQAIHWLQLVLEKDASPSPEAIRAQIDRLRAGAVEPH